MILETEQEVANTRAKLHRLEELYRANLEEPGEMTTARRLEKRSLKRIINQLTEEIIRYETRAMASRA